MIGEEIKKELLVLARKSIEGHFHSYTPDSDQYQDEIYNEKRGAFVTLHKNGQLRGCIGYIIGYKTLKDTIIDMAKAAAFRDPRFNPVTRDELDGIVIEISVLSEMIPVNEITEIVIGRDGLLLNIPLGHGVLLPQVATEYNWDVHTFLKHLSLKAGLKPDDWKDKQSKLYRFSAEVFGESS